jgi:hypothetical protein
LIVSASLTAIAAVFAGLASNELPTALKTERWRAWLLVAVFMIVTIGAGARSLKLTQKEGAAGKRVSGRLRRNSRARLLKKADRMLIEDQLKRSRFYTDPIELDILLSSGRSSTDLDQISDFDTLLILGGKGAGKTTLLFRLADHYLQKARSNPDEPMPVLVSLANWPRAGSDIRAVLVTHLTTVYAIRPDVARRFIEDGDVIPLLDGLDELAGKDRSECANQINSYIADHKPPHLVLTCNQDAYKRLKTPMEVEEIATILQVPPAKIRDYIAQRLPARKTEEIQLQGSQLLPFILSLASPLAIELAIPILGKASVSELGELSPDKSSLNQLVELYVDKALQGSASYSPVRTSRWLGWLANSMSKHYEQEIPYNRLQPNWLPSSLKREAALGIALAYGIVLGVILGVIQGIIFGFLIGFLVGLATAVIISSIRGLSDNRSEFFEWFTRADSAGKRKRSWFRTSLLVLLGANVGIIAVTAGALDAFVLGLLFLLQPGMTGGEEFYLAPFITRLVLAYHGLGPWRYSRFQDYAVERGLLSSFDNRYKFRHSAFYEYFLSRYVA